MKALADILDIILAMHAASMLIVNLTKTPKDNEYMSRFYRCVEVLAGIVTPRAKR